jgi:hypothetical protein
MGGGKSTRWIRGVLHKAGTTRRRLGWGGVGGEIQLNLVKRRGQLEFRENGGDG